MSAKIVLATCLKAPSLSPSDEILAKALQAGGAVVSAAPWNGPFTAFSDADMVVMRTTWDYFDVLDSFFDWFDRLDAAGIATQNRQDVLRWNAKKEYLFELQEKGAPLIPTCRVANGEEISTVSQQQGWSKCVLKCLASGGALGMSLLNPAKPEEVARALEVAAPYAEHGLMLQPFLSQIETAGELSLVFLGGVFSHAIRKTPRKGEIRIQSEFGGTYVPVIVPADILSTARDILALAPGMPTHPCAYARVDGIVVDGQFRLMELEMTEPELMFHIVPKAAVKLARFLLEQAI